MQLTNDFLKAWSGRELIYSAKSMLLKAHLAFSYQFDEDRFIAASSLEVRTMGKVVFSERRSSRYFTKPSPRWSDFTLNGQMILADMRAFDLCLLPALAQVQDHSHIKVYLDKWKDFEVVYQNKDMVVDTGKIKLIIHIDVNQEMSRLQISSPIFKVLTLERE